MRPVFNTVACSCFLKSSFYESSGAGETLCRVTEFWRHRVPACDGNVSLGGIACPAGDGDKSLDGIACPVGDGVAEYMCGFAKAARHIKRAKRPRKTNKNRRENRERPMGR
jgi:hypothetical protein